MKPNTYSLVPDTVEAHGTSESHDDFLEEFSIDQEAQIRLVKIAHMRYQHPDLEEITTFLLDFGMVIAKKTEDRVWFRGYSNDQYVYYAEKGERKFLGGTFEVESFADLEKAAKLPGATEIQELVDAPGGGHLVTVFDPLGLPVNLMYGQTPAETVQSPKTPVLNFVTEKPRKRAFQRFQHGPAAIHKLGHFGLCVTDFPSQLQFYVTTFNFVPSDYIYVEHEGKKMRVTMFAHIDRGEDYVDHHTLFLSSGPSNHVHHCSFEVQDFDTQHLGHQWLAKKGYKSVWGIGRHILGSQIFDYWWDTTGNMIEHYADGDVVNSQSPINYVAASDESLAVWGPELPKSFLA
ncbi:trihydroxytoluene oxygenase [Umbelopsis sp. PMI_123]|nr:trihydroxytoluene oxygenase [Umbelopsis sp. PMI_123]